jgi:hypothetical protein
MRNTQVKHSRRAIILAEVVEYINNGDWDRRGDFLVFGKEAFEIYTGEHGVPDELCQVDS